MTCAAKHFYKIKIITASPMVQKKQNMNAVNKEEQTSITFEKQNNIPLSARVYFILFALKLAFE